MTDAERKLWQRLRQSPFKEHHFRRQATIGRYFCDFASRKLRLVIEVDGGQHAETRSDEVRTGFLNARGYRVLRFWNNDVLGNIEGTLQTIHQAIGNAPHP
jgi:very-short-patch-repair endonuclease